MTNVFFSATSYPRTDQDWQGIFMRRVSDALAHSGVSLRMWAPPGPIHPRVRTALTAGDSRFLDRLAAVGGIAHLLRNQPLTGVVRGAQLVARLHLAARRNLAWTDVFHVNWLQCALAQTMLGKPVLATVLGSDMALLERPGMRSALKIAMRGKKVLLCPNADWMVPRLSAAFAASCLDVVYVPFGVDDALFGVTRRVATRPRLWITVLRVTRKKIGRLFEWTHGLDPSAHQFHLFGPMQEQTDIPPWIHYHGPITPQALAQDWYPRASALVSLSEHDEGKPQVMLEAMAAGVPVIASPAPAHLDLINNGAEGFICTSPDEFLGALQTIGDAEAAASIGSRATQLIRTRYGTWRDCAARYVSLYDRLLAPEQIR